MKAFFGQRAAIDDQSKQRVSTICSSSSPWGDPGSEQPNPPAPDGKHTRKSNGMEVRESDAVSYGGTRKTSGRGSTRARATSTTTFDSGSADRSSPSHQSFIKRSSTIRRLLGNKSAKGSSRSVVTSRTEHHLRNTAAKFVRSLGETVTSVVISQDKHLFAAGATNKKAMVYQVANGQLVAEFTAESGINACAIGGAGYEARLVVGTFAGYIRVYHISSNREEHAIKFGNGDAVFCMALAAGGTRLAVGGKSAHVLLYALSFSSEAVGMNVLHKFATHSSSTLSLSLDNDARNVSVTPCSSPQRL